MEIMLAFASSKPRTKVAVYLCAALFIALNSSPTNGRIEKNSAQRNHSRLLQAVNTHGAKKLLPDELSAVLLTYTIDRKGVVEGTRVYGRVDIGGRRIIQKYKQ